MATTNVPIEIVLQDPDNPIVPTPDPANPGESGENTNIAVPNTALGEGYTTKDGGSDAGSFFSSSAAATIIPAVVLTLAIATIVALLIHKYRKNKKTGATKATRQEKLATAVTSTVAVLAAVVLVGQLGMAATNAATSSEGTELSTPDKIQIIANRYSDVTIVASVEAVSYATTDTTFGYKLFMSMAGDSANLYLDGNTDSEYYFAPTTRAGLSSNSWGYSLDDGAEQAMPLPDNAIMAQQNTSPVEGDEFDVYYSMKADKDMPFGVYSGEITYDIQGQSGFPDTLTTMQGMTSEICDATYTPNAFKTDGVTIEDNVPTATLTDIRDNKTYTVAKLADGKCWMTRNLDLQKEDLLEGVTLDNTNTDNPATGFVLPDSQRGGDAGWVDWSNEETSINTAHVYDTENDNEIYNIPEDELGNFYNWYTATGGTGTYSLANGEFATGSICPSGWRLPNSSVDGSSIDYSTLMYRYNIITSPAKPFITNSDSIYIAFNAPLSLVRNGFYNYGIIGMDTSVYLWSSMAESNGYAGYYAFGNTYIAPWSSNNKYLGFSVRCIAQ